MGPQLTDAELADIVEACTGWRPPVKPAELIEIDRQVAMVESGSEPWLDDRDR